jgi:hypothetical protein
MSVLDNLSKIPSVHVVPHRIIVTNYIHDFIHVEYNTIPSLRNIVILMATKEMLDLRKCFFNWIQIGGVRREVFKPNI